MLYLLHLHKFIQDIECFADHKHYIWVSLHLLDGVRDNHQKDIQVPNQPYDFDERRYRFLTNPFGILAA